MSSSKRLAGRRRSRSEWQVLVGEWRSGGGSVEEFCGRRGLSPATFRWWRWQLSDQGSRGSVDDGSGWVKVDLSGATETAGGGQSGAFELRWPDGLTLRVPPDFDRDALGRLLSTLEASSC